MLGTKVTSATTQLKTRLLTLWQKRTVLNGNYGKTLTLLVCWLLAMLVVIAQSGVITKGEDASLDSGWQMAIASTLQQGHILGRDVYFTYGPFSQLLYGLATVFTTSHSAFDSYGLMIVLHSLITITCLAVILMLIPQINWKYTLFVFIGCVVLNIALASFYYRSLFLVLTAVFLGRALAAGTPRHRLTWAASSGLLAFILQLWTFEMGLYAVMSAVTILVVLIGLSWRKLFRKDEILAVKELALILGIFMGIYLAGNLLISLLFKLTSSAYHNLFDYQILSFEVVRGYNYTFGQPWALSNIGTWVLALVIIYLIGTVAWYCRKVASREAYLLFCLLIASLFELKSAITRSDLGHIAYACLPLLLLFLLLGNDWLKAGKNIKVLWASLLLALIITWPMANLESFKVLGQVFDGKVSITGKIKQLTQQNTPGDRILPKDMLAAGDPNKAVLTFPYEYQYGIGFNKKIVAPFLQSYSAHTFSLQQFYIDTIAQNKDNLEIVYGLDGVVSAAIDGVQNVTRLPRIFEYIYNNFELKTHNLYGSGYMLLKARPKRHDMTSLTLSFSLEKTGSALYTYRLNQVARCSMIRLTPIVNYPIASLVGRPNNFLVDLWSQGNKLLETGLVTIETGKPFSTYISLVDPLKFDVYFSNEPVQTRQFDSIQIKYQPSGLFGVDPASLELTRLECINFQR